jgi:ketosteroid isomerase-like protein
VSDQNKELVRRHLAAEDKHDADAMVEPLAEGWEDKPLWHEPHHLTDQKATTAERHKQAAARQRELFDHRHTTIDEMIDAGDHVVTMATVHAKHRSGKELSWKLVRIDHITNGKIAETHTMWDRLGFWQQLGMVPKTSELVERAEAT